MTISRRDFETKALAALLHDHSRDEILSAIDSYAPPSNKRRPKHNPGNLLAIWVAVEWKRGQAKNGARHSIKRACELLAGELKSIQPGSPNVARPPGPSRLRTLHGEAEATAKREPTFRKLLDDSLAEKRRSLWPDDELLPMILIGGPSATGWFVFSDEETSPKIVA